MAYMHKVKVERRLSFGQLTFVDGGVIIGQINHGRNIGEKEMDELIAAIRDQVGGREFVYVSLRSQDYSVDPLQIHRMAKELNFKAGAFVIPSSRRATMVDHERFFYKKGHTQVFSEME